MIKEFRREYRFLSNFVDAPTVYKGVTYPSSEHAYQSAKSSDSAWKEYCANKGHTSAQVKKMAKLIRPMNWEEIKVNVMRECLESKFSKEPFKSLLIATGDYYIQEGNTWGDIFWGVDLRTGKGSNMLGKLLMELRTKLRNQ